MPKEIKRIGSEPRVKSAAKSRKARRFEGWFMERQRYLIDREANDGKTLWQPTKWQRFLIRFFPRWAPKPPPLPEPKKVEVNTPIVAYNLQPFFTPEMRSRMDAPERLEHIRIGMEHSRLLPLCQYQVLYFTEIPSWYSDDRPVVTRRRYLPIDAVKSAGQEGVLISLSRSRLIATELEMQGAFGAIVGWTPQGFYYEVFGPHESFTRYMIREDRHQERLHKTYVINPQKNIVQLGVEAKLDFNTPEIEIEVSPSEVAAEEILPRNRRFLRRI